MGKRSCLTKNGYLTVYLSIIMAVLLSLCLALIEGARYSTLEFETSCVTEIGLNSIMAEYNRELLRQYNLFAIDSSYLTDYAAKTNTEKHLWEYIERNTSNEGVFLNWLLYRDFLKMKTADVEIMKVRLLSDEHGEVFRRSAVNAVKDDAGLTMLNDLKSWMQEIEWKQLDSGNPEEEKRRIDQEIEEQIHEIQEYNSKDEKNPKEYEEYESPTAFLDHMRREGILKLTVSDTNRLSQKQMNAGTLFGERRKAGQISAGNMDPEEKTDWQNIEERFLFQEYLLKYLGHYGREKEKGALSYQLEYLLGGKDSDIDNLRKVVERICLIRETANAYYLYSDDFKSGEADVLASVITWLIGAPEVKDLLKASIILGWAYAESIYDVKMLLAGGKIPLMKDDHTWHYSLTNALTLWNEGEDSKQGLSYEDYLRTLLMLSDLEEQTIRAMNLIEADLRQSPENRFFRMDACYVELEAKVKIQSEYGYSFEIIREKRYK